MFVNKWVVLLPFYPGIKPEHLKSHQHMKVWIPVAIRENLSHYLSLCCKSLYISVFKKILKVEYYQCKSRPLALQRAGNCSYRSLNQKTIQVFLTISSPKRFTCWLNCFGQCSLKIPRKITGYVFVSLQKRRLSTSVLTMHSLLVCFKSAVRS